jgi:hypothetical protein
MVTRTIIEVLKARKVKALRAFLCLWFCMTLLMALAVLGQQHLCDHPNAGIAARMHYGDWILADHPV